MATMRVEIDLRKLALSMARRGVRYIRVSDLEDMLGVSPVSAGKILSRMAREGLARRFSVRVYELLVTAGEGRVYPVRGNGRGEPEEPEDYVDRGSKV